MIRGNLIAIMNKKRKESKTERVCNHERGQDLGGNSNDSNGASVVCRMEELCTI